MPFASQISHDSLALPGVTFTVHRIGFGRRTEIDLSTLATGQRLRELTADYPPPTEQEKPLAEQLDIAQRKAAAVPADRFNAVWEADVMPLQKELEAVPIPDDVRRKRELLNREYAAVDRMQRAEWIKVGFVSISDGRDVAPGDNLTGITGEQLVDSGPEILAQEIYGVLIADGKLRGAASGTSPSLITSGEAAAGESQNTTAPSAEVQQAAGM